METKGIGLDHIIVTIMIVFFGGFLGLVLWESFDRSKQDVQQGCYITDVEGRQYACSLDEMDTKCLSILLSKLSK